MPAHRGVRDSQDRPPAVPDRPDRRAHRDPRPGGRPAAPGRGPCFWHGRLWPGGATAARRRSPGPAVMPARPVSRRRSARPRTPTPRTAPRAPPPGRRARTRCPPGRSPRHATRPAIRERAPGQHQPGTGLHRPDSQVDGVMGSDSGSPAEPGRWPSPQPRHGQPARRPQGDWCGDHRRAASMASSGAAGHAQRERKRGIEVRPEDAHTLAPAGRSRIVTRAASSGGNKAAARRSPRRAAGADRYTTQL